MTNKVDCWRHQIDHVDQIDQIDFVPETDHVIYRLRLSRTITDPSFNSIPYVEVEIPSEEGVVQPSPLTLQNMYVKRALHPKD